MTLMPMVIMTVWCCRGDCGRLGPSPKNVDGVEGWIDPRLHL